MNLSTKNRLSFAKEEIGTLDSDQLITFKIVANENEYAADPRKIDGVFSCSVRDVKTFFNWEIDKDWSRGHHSWSKFPVWAEAYFKGTLGNKRID